MTDDNIYCEWCMFIEDRLRPGNHEHHVFGRHHDVTIRLCQHHHSEVYHSEGRITRQDIVDKILIPYHGFTEEDIAKMYKSDT